ncbi:MAG: IgGFc-binding protein [Polyangiaceae bacterium]|nr:IgGFc-binding protein [Polyangiaceae bacterium]MCW5791065.1 IgGFc-binding protein [Polyangiaceae bacterium]
MKKGARRALSSLGLALLCGAFVPASCSYDRADRYLGEASAPQAACALGAVRCTLNVERCEDSPGGRRFTLVEDCEGRDQVCNPRELRCTACLPGGTRCTDNQVVQCNDAGEVESVISECDPSSGRVACRSGACVDLCEEARRSRSNVGCEYWAVDLDNAMIDDTSNAAAQQFAVVVSNPQPDLMAHVVIEQDDAEPGSLTPQIQRVASAEIPPMSLRVFKLGPREVDGSPPGEYNTGTHTALTRAAYRVTSQVPVIAYQFNPLENVNVFSNDASLLKPVEAIPGASTLTPAYVVLGWPQTIASTEDPNTNFNPRNPTDLRAFVTIVGTRPDTQVRVHPKTRVLGAPGVPETRPGEALDLVLQPFDVLNLETDDFNADLTGSLIEATHPVVVFSGSEASDAPFFSTLASRRCCADHLEEQLDPIRTAGKRFIAPVAASRTRALDAAGASIGIISEPDYFRVIAVSPRGARVRTTLPGREAITLPERGSFVDLTAEAHFLVESDEPVMLGNVSPSQMAAGVPRSLPGGDPSFLIIPPIEQFRARYVFLTPDKYAFDFIRVIAPRGARVLLDGSDIEGNPNCERAPGDGLSVAERGGEPAFYVHTCQLSFPVVNPALDAPDNLSEGRQNDGVHRIDSDRAVGVLVDGFDAFVSYAYAAGTDLRDIAVF